MSNGDDPDIGGPEGGKTRSHMHFQRLPQWSAPTPTKFELTDREKAIAEIASYKYKSTLRAVVLALTLAGLIVAGGTALGWYFVDREANRAIHADREGCERVNVLRENQAQVLQDQIAQSEIALKGPLGSLETFRDEISGGLKQRKRNLRRLRLSVREYPVRDRRADGTLARPYAISCRDAFP